MYEISPGRPKQSPSATKVKGSDARVALLPSLAGDKNTDEHTKHFMCDTQKDTHCRRAHLHETSAVVLISKSSQHRHF